MTALAVRGADCSCLGERAADGSVRVTHWCATHRPQPPRERLARAAARPQRSADVAHKAQQEAAALGVGVIEGDGSPRRAGSAVLSRRERVTCLPCAGEGFVVGDDNYYMRCPACGGEGHVIVR